MVSISILHFIGLLLLLLAASFVDGLNSCRTKECLTEEPCHFSNTKTTKDYKCSFVLAVNDNCSFIGAIGASYNETGKYVKNHHNSSSLNLTIVSYTTTGKSIQPALIVSNNTAESSKWLLDNSFASNSTCSDEVTKILCTLLADPAAVIEVNKTMCPDPTTTTTTTTVIPTTTVLRTTKNREMVSEETSSVAAAFIKPSSVDERSTTEEAPSKSWPVWAIILICLSPLVLLAAAVFGFLAWKRKCHKSADAKKKEEKNKEEKAPEAPNKNTEQKEEGDYGALNRTNPDVARILERSKKRDPATLAAILQSSRVLLDAGNPYVREMNLKMDSSEAGLKQMMRRVSALSQNGFDGKPILATNEEGEKVEFYKALPAKYQKEIAPRKRRTSEQQRKIIADLKQKKALEEKPKEVAVAPKEEETNKEK